MLRSRIASSSSRSLARRSSSARSMASARWSLSMPWRLKTRTSTTVPVTPGGTRRLVSRTSAAFSPKMARSSFSSGVIEVLERLFADIGDVAGDFLRPELGVARHGLEFLDMDRGEDVVAHDALGDEDGVLEVVAVPGHEGDQR